MEASLAACEIGSGLIFSPHCNIGLKRSLGHLRPRVKPSNFISGPHKRIWRTLSCPANLQICAADQRDWESPVRVGKYFSVLSDSRQFKDCHHREKSILHEHPAKVNSVTLWSVLDGVAARGAYRGCYTALCTNYTGCIIWSLPVWTADIYHPPHHCQAF